MAGYPKIWTSILDEDWFIPLSATKRGIILQLILLAKKQGDMGSIRVRSISMLAEMLGTDRGTLTKVLREIQQLNVIKIEGNIGVSSVVKTGVSSVVKTGVSSVVTMGVSTGEISASLRNKNTSRILIIELPKYKYYQDLKRYNPKRENNKLAEKPAGEDRITVNSKNPKEPKYIKSEKSDHVSYDEIISDLNNKAKTNYKSTTKETRKLIKARWDDGFRLADFQKVHSNKVITWLDDPERQRYLRPVTLYRGSLFEGYLNEINPQPYKTKENSHGTNIGDTEKERLKKKYGKIGKTVSVSGDVS